jgi:hypothetical protein
VIQTKNELPNSITLHVRNVYHHGNEFHLNTYMRSVFRILYESLIWEMLLLLLINTMRDRSKTSRT